MKRIAIFIPLIFLSACASKKSVVVHMPPPVSGTILSSDDMESVRYGENVKAYSLGRYIDPNDPLVMHEAHTIYRVETTAKWNLHPNAPEDVPAGPVSGIIDSAHVDSPITPIVAAEVSRQKALTQALLQQSREMNAVVNEFAKAIPATLTVATNNARLESEVDAANSRIDALADEFRRTQSANTFTVSADPSTKGTNDW